ncbi:MAG: phenylalanyl-tRNA synthetase subunit beta, phenylalanyl-tRNA synthetase beta chain [Candidatus Adlerbacteria bacterium]|nr:phenylalanyl-tRNA synthetase subunit beta, phenylalanyl-tRNA synthetase beta chain [Candidatus Adlerbacteria bacterium]
MQISRNWLNNFFDAELPPAEALADALTFHAFEIDGIDEVSGDHILDVKVTPNRGHDCLSHRGIAKELSAILNIPLTKDPFKLDFDISKKTDAVTVTIEDPKLCKRYIAGYIKGVKVAPSPEWLKQSLEAIGQRSINNVVDATNLVMFNTGQPLHAFDAKRLGSLSIGVRAAKLGEELEALDKKIYKLDPSLLVITAEDRPVGIAGIKGGEADRIDESTTDIVLESATFDGVTIRRGAHKLKLRTDASSRFEQVLSPELCAHGMRACAKLILEIAGGECDGFVDVYPEPQPQAYAAVTVEKINRLLGTQLTGADIADAFVRLGFAYKEQDGVFEVHVPAERLDLVIAEDLVEEVARIVGYDKVPATPLPQAERAPEVNKNFYAAEKVREDLTSKGYSEVFTSVFADKGERVVLNKVDGVRPYLRDSLVPGLADALARNKPNKDLLGLKEVRLFEIGTVWKGGKEVVMLGTVSEKEKATEMLLVGPESPEAYDELPLSTTERYQSFSKYPYIVRDIALWVPADTSAEAVLENIKAEAGPLCAAVRLFDTFSKEGRTSLAFRLIFQSFEKTLTEAEANEAMGKVSDTLKAQGFEIR